MMASQKLIEDFLEELNTTHYQLHKKYEDLYWLSHMGDHSVDPKFTEAQAKRDAFKANPKHTEQIREYLRIADPKNKKRLEDWLYFFSYYQMPKKALVIKDKIAKLESKIQDQRIKLAKKKEGYIDPVTKKFVQVSVLQLAFMMSTHPDEKMRKAAFEAREKL